MLSQSAQAEIYETLWCIPVSGTKLDESTEVHPTQALSNMGVMRQLDKERALVTLLKDDNTYAGSAIYDLISEKNIYQAHYAITSSEHAAGLIIDMTYGSKNAKRYYISSTTNWVIEYNCEEGESVELD